MLGLLVTSVAVGIATFASIYAEKFALDRVALINEKDARFHNELVFSRVGQALSNNAVLCREADMSCRWNSDDSRLDHQPKQYGLKSLSSSSDKSFRFESENCLPIEDAMDVSNCKTFKAEGEIRIASIQELIDNKLIQDTRWTSAQGGSTSTSMDDTDHYGAVITVKSKYMTAGGKVQDFVTTGFIRRPRSVVKIFEGKALCEETCHVPEGETRTEAMCYGRVKTLRGEKNAAKMRGLAIFNEGPGYALDLQLKRQFAPHPAFASDVTEREKAPAVIYDNKGAGLAPGMRIDNIADSDLPCAHRTVPTSRTSTTGGGVTVSYGTSSIPTGSAAYSFSKVTPANMMSVGQASGGVPAMETHVHTVIRVRGQN